MERKQEFLRGTTPVQVFIGFPIVSARGSCHIYFVWEGQVMGVKKNSLDKSSLFVHILGKVQVDLQREFLNFVNLFLVYERWRKTIWAGSIFFSLPLKKKIVFDTLLICDQRRMAIFCEPLWGGLNLPEGGQLHNTLQITFSSKLSCKDIFSEIMMKYITDAKD